MESDRESKALVTAGSGALTRPADAGRLVPTVVAAAGDKAARRYLEFFAVTIENPNTRQDYFRACRRFFDWCERKRLDELVAIEPMHVASHGTPPPASTTTTPRRRTVSQCDRARRSIRPPKSLAIPGEALLQDHDPLELALPFTDEQRTGLQCDALPSLWGAPVEGDAGAIVRLWASDPPLIELQYSWTLSRTAEWA